jgi:hypothetical protein
LDIWFDPNVKIKLENVPYQRVSRAVVAGEIEAGFLITGPEANAKCNIVLVRCAADLKLYGWFRKA